MIAPVKAQALQAFLASLPPAMAARLAKAVEVDRLADGDALPHELILEGLRPVLRRSESARTLTPVRLFCRPFEDLLTGAPRKEKQKARVGRESITPVWEWLGTSLVPGPMETYAESAREAILGNQIEAAISRAAEFWEAAAAAMLDALSGADGRKAARRALGGDLILADAEDMARLMAVGPEILEVQAVLAKPVVSLREDMLWALREIYDRIVLKLPDAAPYVAVVAMNRIERPWEALKLPLFVVRQTKDTLISSTDMGLVGEIVFSEIEAHTAAIRAMRPAQFDAEALVNHVAAFSELSMGIVKEVEMRRAGKWGQRLMAARAAVSEAMDGFMERCPREILAALPTHRASYSGGPRSPDFSRAPDGEKLARARACANLMVCARPFAAAASFGASLKDASDEITAFLRAYNEDILRELRAAEGEARDRAQACFEIAAEFTGLLFSQEEGELLRRRGRAAMASAAA